MYIYTCTPVSCCLVGSYYIEDRKKVIMVYISWLLFLLLLNLVVSRGEGEPRGMYKIIIITNDSAKCYYYYYY